MKFAAPIIFSLGCLLASNQVLAAKVYKWTDAEGITHYSAQPPLNTKTEIIKPEIGHSDPVTYASPAPSPSPNAGAQNPAAAAEQKAGLKDKDRCEQARKNRETLKTYSHIKIKGDNGEYRFLTADEQKTRLEEAEKVIAESCE